MECKLDNQFGIIRRVCACVCENGMTPAIVTEKQLFLWGKNYSLMGTTQFR